MSKFIKAAKKFAKRGVKRCDTDVERFELYYGDLFRRLYWLLIEVKYGPDKKFEKIYDLYTKVGMGWFDIAGLWGSKEVDVSVDLYDAVTGFCKEVRKL